MKARKNKQIQFIASWIACLIAVALFTGCATDSQPTLHRAIREGDTQLAKEMIERRAYINVIDTQLDSEMVERHAYINGNKTPLMLAIDYKRIEIAKLLIKNGANINARNSLGFTPLMAAATTNLYEIGKFLLEKGADIHARDTWGWDSLHYAAYKDSEEMVDLLINNGAEVYEAEGQKKTLYLMQDNRIEEKGHAGTGIIKEEIEVDRSGETIYINAMLYRYAARYALRNGDNETAIKYYKLAQLIFDKAYLFFNERAALLDDQMGNAFTQDLIVNMVSIAFAGIASTSAPPGTIITPGTQHTDLSQLRAIKKYFKDQAKKANQYYSECKQITMCYETSAKGMLSECFK